MPQQAVEFRVTGLKELQDKLDRLPAEVTRKILRTALRAGMLVMRDEIRLLATKLTGWMASQVVVKTKTNNLDQGTAKVTFSKKPNPKSHAPAIYEALWKEFGVPAHGIPARPFIRPAFESKKAEVVSVFSHELKRILDESFHK